MEDAHVAVSNLKCKKKSYAENPAFFAVFDGHGGREVAYFCRRRLIEVVRNLLTHKVPPKVALTRAFESMDELLQRREFQSELGRYQQAKSSSSTAAQKRLCASIRATLESEVEQARSQGSYNEETANTLMNKMVALQKFERKATGETNSWESPIDNVGCTAVSILLTPDSVVCANAGDSRAVLCRNGVAVDLSRDHKPQLPGERQRIENAGAVVEEVTLGSGTHFRINGRLNLSRAIGDMKYKGRADLPHDQQAVIATPEVMSMKLTSDDEFILLACDGIWDMKTSAEACQFVRIRLAAGRSPIEIVEELLDDCLADDPKDSQGRGCDNMTCILVQLTPGDGAEKTGSGSSGGSRGSVVSAMASKLAFCTGSTKSQSSEHGPEQKLAWPSRVRSAMQRYRI
eukprot:CAMPEP_0170621202 /NCGR_PEP_ID=MMETSP0224-20130122/28479_1 /TAXON_ID=285029 /ORGANISM="Togula jolla, Strain CCCM 725" /LENGTH=401 /DNA_ID=CAMNT_0010947453 /DNA_START=24 /DNA_END=1229 /DNA_ORIENTATION=+